MEQTEIERRIIALEERMSKIEALIKRAINMDNLKAQEQVNTVGFMGQQ